MKKLPALITVLLLSVLLAGCVSLRPEPPEVSLKQLQITELSLSHATLQAGLQLYNPNAIGVTIQRVDYQLLLNGIRVSHGHSARPVTLAAESAADLDLRLTAAYLDLLRFVNSTGTSEALNYTLLGEIEVGGMGLLSVKFPLKREGVIQLQNRPR